jgi:hypothetical protein
MVGIKKLKVDFCRSVLCAETQLRLMNDVLVLIKVSDTQDNNWRRVVTVLPAVRDLAGIIKGE